MVWNLGGGFRLSIKQFSTEPKKKRRKLGENVSHSLMIDRSTTSGSSMTRKMKTKTN